jgi:hypothetical protein
LVLEELPPPPWDELVDVDCVDIELCVELDVGCPADVEPPPPVAESV